MPNACVASVGRSANPRQHGDDARHLIAEARLLPHAGERHALPENVKHLSNFQHHCLQPLMASGVTYSRLQFP